MFGRRRARRDEMVVTSRLVLDEGVRVHHVSRTQASTWVFLSGFEEDSAEPLTAHFHHVADANISLWTLALRRGEYALRGQHTDEWHVFGPVSDDEYDRLCDDGTILRQHDALDMHRGA